MEVVEFTGRREAPAAGESPSEMVVRVREPQVVEGPAGAMEALSELRVSLIGQDLSMIPEGSQVTVSAAWSFRGPAGSRRTSSTTRIHLRWTAGRRRTLMLDGTGRASYDPEDPGERRRVLRDPRVESMPRSMRDARRERERAAVKPKAVLTTKALRGRAAIEAAAEMSKARSTSHGGKKQVSVMVGDVVCVNLAAAAELVGRQPTTVKRAADRRGSIDGVPIVLVGQQAGRADLTLKASALLALANEAVQGKTPAMHWLTGLFGGAIDDAASIQLHPVRHIVPVGVGRAWFVREGGGGLGMRSVDRVRGRGAAVGSGGGPCLERWPD